MLVVDAVVVTVTCPAEVRHARELEGRGWSGERARAVDAWQWSERDKIAASHYVLDNSGPAEELPGKVRSLLERLDERRSAAGTALADTLRALWGERVPASDRGRPDEEGVLSCPSLFTEEAAGARPGPTRWPAADTGRACWYATRL